MPEWVQVIISILLMLIVGPWVMLAIIALVAKFIIPIHLFIADKIGDKIMDWWEKDRGRRQKV